MLHRRKSRCTLLFRSLRLSPTSRAENSYARRNPAHTCLSVPEKHKKKKRSVCHEIAFGLMIYLMFCLISDWLTAPDLFHPRDGQQQEVLYPLGWVSNMAPSCPSVRRTLTLGKIRGAFTVALQGSVLKFCVTYIIFSRSFKVSALIETYFPEYLWCSVAVLFSLMCLGYFSGSARSRVANPTPPQM